MIVWPRTLRARLTLWYTALLTATLAALAAVALLLLDRGLRQNVDASLQSVARSAAESVRARSPLDTDFDALLESMLGPSMAQHFFRLLDPLGRPDPRTLRRGQAQLPLTPEALRNAQAGRETFETFSPDAARAPIRLLTMPVIDQGHTIRLVQVAMSLHSAETARRRFLLILLGLAPFALAVAAGGGWFLARRALAPVDAMVEAARRIEAEDLSRRLATTATSNDELGRLAAVLNDMLGRLERSFAAVRQFSADAAHELRTPLTILKGEIEVALRSSPAEQEYRRVLGSCLEEVDRLSALVADLLFLARSEGGHVRPPRTPVNLSQVVADVTPALRTLADHAAVTLTTSADEPLRVGGSEPLLFRLFFNLGENAIKYTPPGGTVSLTLTADAAAKEARLEVRDTGPGIAPGDQAHIFDRFYRADPARSRGGAGLGLALARSITLIHGGRITVDSEPGRGTCFRVALPFFDAH